MSVAYKKNIMSVSLQIQFTTAFDPEVKMRILWFHQYLLNTSFREFCCWVDPQKVLFIEVQHLILYVLITLTKNILILETVIFSKSTKIGAQEY